MKNKFETYLIDAVRKQTLLYDRNADGYSNKERIDNAWIEVANEVALYVKNVSLTHCKLRWRTLRDRFVKQIARTPDGIERFKPEASRWEYTRRMSFLTSHLKKRKCDETFVPVNIKNEADTYAPRSNCSNPHSFSFVEAKAMRITPDSLRSRIPSVSETQESEYELEPEIEIEMPQPSVKRKKINFSDISLEGFDTQEPELVTTDSCNHKVSLNENNLNKLLSTTNELLQQQIKQNARKSPNEAYFKVLDGYFAKLSPDDLDKVKVEILNLIILKKKKYNENSMS